MEQVVNVNNGIAMGRVLLAPLFTVTALVAGQLNQVADASPKVYEKI